MFGRLCLIYLSVCMIVFIDAQIQQCYTMCQQIMQICPPGANIFTDVEGDDRVLTCPGLETTVTHHQSPNQTSRMPINMMADDRYIFTGTTLRIASLQGTDEGVYWCNDGQNTSFCLTVTETAKFATCNGEEPNGIECGEEIVNVTAGDNAEFDTRLVYNGMSDCSCYQRFAQFKFKSDDTNNISVSFLCTGLCETPDLIENISQTQQSNIPFDFNLVLQSVQMDYNGSTFSLSAFGIGTGGMTNQFTKTFRLIVTMPVTTSPEPTTTTTPGQDTIGIALGGAIAGIFLALLIVVIISVVVCVLYQRFVHKRFKLSKDPVPEDPEYAEICDLGDSGKFTNRNSRACSSARGPPSSANVDLTDTLESASAVC